MYEINVERIAADVNQPRKAFDEKDLVELAESIKTYGLIQPIIVRPNNAKMNYADDQQTYTIIAGERRYRASLLAGCRNVKVLIRDANDSMEISLIENIQRRDLNKIEEAAAIKQIMSEKGYTQEQVAIILSKSRPYITNALRLLNLSPKLQQALIEEKISDAHARVLVGVKEEKEKMKLLERIINEKMSVRESERYSKRLREKQDVFLKDAIERLEEAMECRVYTKGDAKKGTLCISYDSEADLESVVGVLLNSYEK